MLTVPWQQAVEPERIPLRLVPEENKWQQQTTNKEVVLPAGAVKIAEPMAPIKGVVPAEAVAPAEAGVFAEAVVLAEAVVPAQTVVPAEVVVLGKTAKQEEAAAAHAISSTAPLAPRARPVVWSNDFHIATIGNVKALLQPLGVKFIDKSLSGHCHLTKTCATNLKVLNFNNGVTPSAKEKKEFARVYADDSEMSEVDVAMCFHPAAMCEIFMPLHKRLFVIATTRYEFGRYSPSEWQEWNDNLLIIAGDKNNVVAANNVYDQYYIQYFTGIQPILLPSVVEMAEKYSGTSPDIVVAAMHPEQPALWRFLKGVSPQFRGLREKYKFYSYKHLCENTAILHLPYQVSIMSLYEQYAMGIPILVPGPRFLWELHDRYDLVTERTWHRVRTGQRPKGSVLPGWNTTDPDPNDDRNGTAFQHWVQYADFYQLPHIIRFNSWDDLREILRVKRREDWLAISANMRRRNEQLVKETTDMWKTLMRIRDFD